MSELHLSQQNATDTPNGTTVPSQEEHADALGVGHRTVSRWEKDRKEIAEDPELSAKATTLEGYKEAKKVIRDRRETVERKGLLYAPRSSQVIEPLVVKT